MLDSSRKTGNGANMTIKKQLEMQKSSLEILKQSKRREAGNRN
jgi:hypothetical protein